MEASAVVISESRRRPRPRVLKGATIITGIRNCEIACSLRNQHEEGAELKVGPEERVPERFLLYVPLDGVAYRAELRWRKGERAGVKFVGVTPKPRAHYG